MSPPFFSVVMPLYNKAAHVHASMASVLAQTHTDFELIIVDDGSSDTSVDVVRGIPSPRVRLVQQPHTGVSAARNRGIAEARGTWIAFLDADDLYLPEFLAEVRTAIHQWPTAGVVYSNIHWQTSASELLPPQRLRLPPRLLPDYFQHIVYNGACEIHSSNVTVKKDLFAITGAFPERVHLGEDSDLWMRLAWSTRIVHIPRSLAVYQRWASATNWEQQTNEPFWMTTWRDWLRQGRIPPHLKPSTRAYVAWTLLGKAIVQSKRGQHTQARATFRSAVTRHAPKRFLLKAALLICLERFRKPRNQE